MTATRVVPGSGWTGEPEKSQSLPGSAWTGEPGGSHDLSSPLGRCYLVINPGAHNGRSSETAALYRALLEGAAAARPADEVRLEAGHTRVLEDARTIARRALLEGFDTIVAIGGDGTINRVMSAFMECHERRPYARLGVLYSGTSPDFCRFHGLPIDPRDAVDTLLEGRSQPIDVCRISHRTASGEPRRDFFASSANIGLGAGIAARANRMRPRVGDFLGTLAATVLTISGRGPRRIRLRIDGEEIALPPALNVTIGKNPHLAGGLKLETRISPSDGRMFVFGLCGIGRLGLLRSLHRIYSGSITRDARFLLRDARSVRIEPLDGDLETEFDGDPAGFCPAEIEIVPGAVNLIGGRP